jgi:uncharacterized membrane protein HdeD (DUF308 family)
MRLFLIRGLVAIAWAIAFAAVSDSLTTVTVAAGILLVAYPLIDVAASLLEARVRRGSTRRALLVNAAGSALAAGGLAIAATGSVADVVGVFGAWAVLAGLAQLVVTLRRRAALGPQWPLLVSSVGSVVLGIVYLAMAFGDDPQLHKLALYAAGGGAEFVIQAGLLARRRRRPLAPVPA